MTENDVNPPINSDPMEKINEFIDHPSYIAPGPGLITPWGRNFDVNRNILSLRSIVASSNKSLWSLILYNYFMILYMYIAPGQGQTVPRGQNFDVNRNVLSRHSFVASLKNVFEVWFYTFFSCFNTCIESRGRGRQPLERQSFDVNGQALNFYPFVASFKEISLKSDFIHFFHDLLHVYSPGEGGGFRQPPGDNVLMSKEASCHFGHLLLVSNHRRQ